LHVPYICAWFHTGLRLHWLTPLHGYCATHCLVLPRFFLPFIPHIWLVCSLPLLRSCMPFTVLGSYLPTHLLRVRVCALRTVTAAAVAFIPHVVPAATASRLVTRTTLFTPRRVVPHSPPHVPHSGCTARGYLVWLNVAAYSTLRIYDAHTHGCWLRLVYRPTGVRACTYFAAVATQLPLYGYARVGSAVPC